MNFEIDLLTWGAMWIAGAVFILARQWRIGSGVGLVLAYIVSFGVMHWWMPVLHLLPWYEPPYPEFTVAGLRESAFAMLGLVLGTEVASAWTLRRDARRKIPPSLNDLDEPLANLYLWFGIILYGGLSSAARGIPTVNALVGTGSTLIVAGLAMKVWICWNQERSLRMWFWLAAATAMPIITVVAQGFLGYGFAAMAMVFCFLASIYQSKTRVVLVGLLIAFLGSSVYVTYMRDRREIRRTVWGGAAFSDRVERLSETISAFEWFDYTNVKHIRLMDSRLDQDYLIGAAVAYLREGKANYALGSTLWDSVVALVPRILWRQKPQVAGSGDMVANFTGFKFAEGTSVGIGHVLEWYINFGRFGVIAGFFIFGFALVVVDRACARLLAAGNSRIFLLWYLPGLSLLAIGWSFSELTSTGAAALVMAWMMERYTVSWTKPAALAGRKPQEAQ